MLVEHTTSIANLKCYVITVSNFFPKGHISECIETLFEVQILNGNKKHTIRTNVEFWKKRIQNVMEGKAYISIRRWSGKPYRSKQVEIKKLFKHDGVGFEVIEKAKETEMFNINEKVKYGFSLKEIAKNDGLEPHDFKDWFKDWKKPEKKIIIHLTKYRYFPELTNLFLRTMSYDDVVRLQGFIYGLETQSRSNITVGALEVNATQEDWGLIIEFLNNEKMQYSLEGKPRLTPEEIGAYIENLKEVK